MNVLIWIYKITDFLSNFFSHTIRYLIYRSAVIEPSNLKLLYRSESAYSKVKKTNKKITHFVNNKTKRVGFLGQLSQSMLLNKDFWSHPIPEGIDIYLYELNAEGYAINKSLKKFNHSIFKAYWHKTKWERVYKDTFDYKTIASKINQDELDMLVVSIETIGRFTYGKLFDEIITSTKIVVTNPGNYFYYHPKVYGQGQIQLPPCWDIKDNVLYNNEGFEINDFKFFPNLFHYDKRDIIFDGAININFDQNIFIHGRLSLLNDISFLKTLKKILLRNDKCKCLIMGINDHNSLKQIQKYFKKNNLINRLEYLGCFYMNFSDNGIIEHENWNKTKRLLKSSGVFLNPFPKGAGSARMEAFLSGLPVIDLEIDFMNPKNKRLKEYVLKPLIKKNGTAFNEEDYIHQATKALNDFEFRKKIIDEQYDIANDFFKEERFWNKLKTILNEKH